MKTLYDDLEVSKTASKEVIEKTYKVLAKKYHPDLQDTPEAKKKAQEKMVKINAAYEVLGDEQKKKEYDQELEAKEQEEILKKQAAQNNNSNVQNVAQKAVNNFNNAVQSVYTTVDQKTVEDIRRQAYVDAQNDYNRAYVNRYYTTFQKIRYYWNYKKTLKLLLAIGIINAIVAILFLVPNIRSGMINFYETSKILKIFINLIEVICNLIANIFIGIVKNIRGF